MTREMKEQASRKEYVKSDNSSREIWIHESLTANS